MHIKHLREIANLRQTRHRKRIRRPRRRLIQIQMRDDLRLNPPMPRQLRTDRLSRNLITDEQTPLSRRDPQRHSPRNRTRQDQPHRQRQPQKQRLMTIQRPMRDQPPRQPRHQSTQSRQLKQLRRLIQRRLTQQRLIPVIQTRQLRTHHQNRNPSSSRPRQLQRPPRKLNRQHKRTNNRHHISHQQQPPKQRIPPHTRRRTTNLSNPPNNQPTPPTQPQKPTRTTNRPPNRQPTRINQRRSPSDSSLGPIPRLDTHSRLPPPCSPRMGPCRSSHNPNSCRDP